MKCNYIKPLKSVSLIEEYERNTGFFFPHSFRRFTKKNNGGRPERCLVRIDNNEYCVKTFLSFNRTDRETVWNHTEWQNNLYNGKYIPFANDNFGNLFCFSSNSDESDTIIFWNHETNTVIHIADSFDEFLNMLE